MSHIHSLSPQAIGKESTKLRSVLTSRPGLVVLAILALGTFSVVASVGRSKLLNSSQPALAAVEQKEKVKPVLLDSIPILIGRRGFEPASFSHSKDKFFILVENRSNVPDVQLRLDSVQGNRVHDVYVGRETKDWAEVLDLNPGEYILSVADHPEWTCRITITAH